MLTYILSMGAFALQGQSSVIATETVYPQIFAMCVCLFVCLFTENSYSRISNGFMKYLGGRVMPSALEVTCFTKNKLFNA